MLVAVGCIFLLLFIDNWYLFNLLSLQIKYSRKKSAVARDEVLQY